MVWLMPDKCMACQDGQHDYCTEQKVPYGIFGGSKCPCDHVRAIREGKEK